MDKLDAKILDLLQENAELTAAEIADRVGLSKAPCWRRIQKLTADGVIRGKVVLLDAHALNVGTTVFVTLKTGNHSEAWFERFVRAVRIIPEVTEIHRMSGDADYLLRIVVPDVAAYEQFLKQSLTRIEGVAGIKSSFALKQVKYSTVLPLDAGGSR
jgi:Lrp/AsnC family transcriptional regulator